MTASLLQAFMDQLMNLLLASVAIIIGGITAMAIIDSAPRMSRWGFSNVLAFFGKGEDKNWTVQVERNGKTYNLPKEYMAKLQQQGYEVYEGKDKNQIYMRHPNGDYKSLNDSSSPVGFSEDDFELDGDHSFLENDEADGNYEANENTYDFLHVPDHNVNSYEWLKHESTDYDDDENEPISKKEAA